MRDQYAGDVSDFLKCALLRALAGNDRTLGIGWYYQAQNDGRTDGCHREWCDDPAWRDLDAQVFDGLKGVDSVAALEAAGFWPKQRVFFKTPVPTQRERARWAEEMAAKLDGVGLVFLDPDTGFGRRTRRHVQPGEIAAIVRIARRPVVFISFPGRNMPHADIVARLHNTCRNEIRVQRVTTLRTSFSIRRDGRSIPRQRWFTLLEGDAEILERLRQFHSKIAESRLLRALLDNE